MSDLKNDLKEFDVDGHLSIIVQGGLFSYNIVEIANNISHWRQLFPNAQIIFSISTTDLIDLSFKADSFPKKISVSQIHRDNLQFITALEIILSCADLVVFADGILPLPPIKVDSQGNNYNLQLRAAQAGLKVATGRYVLRVRSDFVFFDRSFLAYYLERFNLPRTSGAITRQRILISSFFTLNPFTLERMPFHFSDWFHFGLTEDVRALWAGDAIKFSDAIYYSLNEHPPHSNDLERKFLVRIAVEQHLHFGFYGKFFEDVTLNHMNDFSCREKSMRVLLDDFVLCDIKKTKAYFPKYHRRLSEQRLSIACLSPQDWDDLISLGENVNFEEFFSKRITIAKKILGSDIADKRLRQMYLVAGDLRFFFGTRIPALFRLITGRS